MHRPRLFLLAGTAVLALAGALLAQPGTLTVPPDRAVLIIRVPADATLTVGGEATKQTGPERWFTTPVLVPGYTYSYEVVASWKDKTEKRTIQFQAGQTKSVDVGTTAKVSDAPKKTDIDKKPFTDKKPDTDKKPFTDKKPDIDKKPFSDKRPDTDRKPTDVKPATDKTESVVLPSMSGVLKAVDAEKGSFVLAQEDGKTRTFVVNESTKFVGAKGGSRGMGKAALKDETMVPGSAVRVVPAADGNAALEVHLPARNSAPKDAAKEKAKTDK